MKKNKTFSIPRAVFRLPCLLVFLLTTGLTVFITDVMGSTTGRAELNKHPGFSFDCDNTPAKPCRKLVAEYNGKPITIEPSSVAWSNRFNKAIVVSDNYNDLVQHQAEHYVIVYFGLEEIESKIAVKPLLTPRQAVEFPLYDLEGVTLQGDRLYTIGSLALHGKDPSQDRWERHQFIRMELRQMEKSNLLGVENLAHVTRRWPNFRDWLISKSGHAWTAEETRGRAEAEGINIEALSITDAGTVMMGFRGPLMPEGGAMAIEFKLPASPDHEPVLVRKYALPQVDFPDVPKGTPKTLRAMVEVPGEPGAFYVLLGPKGYEKEEIVLAHWNSQTGQLSRTTQLPEGFVAEGVAPIAEGRLLIVDDLREMIIIATEN